MKITNRFRVFFSPEKVEQGINEASRYENNQYCILFLFLLLATMGEEQWTRADQHQKSRKSQKLRTQKTPDTHTHALQQCVCVLGRTTRHRSRRRSIRRSISRSRSSHRRMHPRSVQRRQRAVHFRTAVAKHAPRRAVVANLAMWGRRGCPVKNSQSN
jgi:hypothetical protein